MSRVSDGIDEKTKEIKDYSTEGMVQYENGYDMNQNHTENKNGYIDSGNYLGAKYEEQYHNNKVRDTGLPYAPTNDFNWSNPNGYAMEKKLEEINDYTKKGFTYNPEEDAVYQSLDKRYKSQALDNYNDNITSLARQYGGEIPAYLKQIAKNNYQTEAGRANDAIPTLSQMAWDMWGDTRNDMYNQYNLLANENMRDYARYSDNLGRILDSQNNMYNRNVTDRQLRLAEDEYLDSKNYKMGDTIFSIKNNYMSLGYSEQMADEMAKREYAQLYGGYIPSAVSSSGTPEYNPIGGTGLGKASAITPDAKLVEDDDAELVLDGNGNPTKK